MNACKKTTIILCCLVAAVFSCFVATDARAQTSKRAYRAAIVKDWMRQERDLGREIGSVEALQAAVERAENFHEWASDEDWVDEEALQRLQTRVDQAKAYLAKSDDAENDDFVSAFRFYLELRESVRQIALSNPEIKGRPIAFLKQERFVWQMLHEFLSYYYEKCGMRGGGVYVLKAPGESFETESLTDAFPRGVFETASLSYDAKSVYVAFADFSKVQAEDMPKTDVRALQGLPYVDDFTTNYGTISDGKFHLYKINIADKSFEQLTDGPDDDFDPTEAPDGSLVFMSTRRGGFGRCHGHYEPLAVHTLHRLNPDKTVTRLSWHETNEWQPSFLQDGRILYTRWDYVDRAASRHHGLWTTNPDGTNSAIFFGNYTFDVNACYQGKAIPNSNKVMFVGGAHHLDVGGSLLAFDPSKMKYDPTTGKDDLASIEFLTPNVELPEVDGATDRVSKQYYYSPWPLSEDVWLTSYSHDALGGYLANTTTSGKLGLYYGDRFGNLELLYQNDENDESCMFPMPLVEREKPAVLPSSLPDNPTEASGTFVLSNVYESLFPFPKNRKVKELRIVQLLPKHPGYISNNPSIGHANAGNARLVLGTVPVEEDGSAHFKAPANVPVYFQAIDENGVAVQSMRSIVYLQPGENRGCVGCHEQAQTALTNDPSKRSLASLREPSELKPAPENTAPFSYPLFVQPILDRRCVSCHDGSEGKPAPRLTGEITDRYTKSYEELRPYLRWYEWGGATYREIVTMPGEVGADICPLSKTLDDENHANIGLTDQEKRDLYLWQDLLSPFYGTFEPEEQAKQQRGEVIEIPALQ